MKAISENRDAPIGPTETGTAGGQRPLQLLPGAPEAANRMYGMIVGYWTSQIAGVLARLRVPDHLAAGAQNAAELAAELDCRADTLFRLLRAASAAGILDAQDDGCFALSPAGATLQSD